MTVVCPKVSKLQGRHFVCLQVLLDFTNQVVAIVLTRCSIPHTPRSARPDSVSGGSERIRVELSEFCTWGHMLFSSSMPMRPKFDQQILQHRTKSDLVLLIFGGAQTWGSRWDRLAVVLGTFGIQVSKWD